MKKKFSFLLVFGFVCLTAFAQSASRKEIRKAWKNIPSNIEQAMTGLDILFSDSTRKDFMRGDEQNAAGRYNQVQGMAIRNSWKLWRGSDLSRYFNRYDVYDPELMSWFIFTSYHRWLNKKPIAFEQQLIDYVAFSEKIKANPPRFTDKFKVGDTVLRYQFDTKGVNISLSGNQRSVIITALVKAIEPAENKLQIAILQITRTKGDRVEELAEYILDRNLIYKGMIFWTGLVWWRKAVETNGADVR